MHPTGPERPTLSKDPVLALREQILALDHQHAAGEIDSDTHARERALLEQRLVQAVVHMPVRDEAQRPSAFNPRSWSARAYAGVAFGLAAAVLVATVLTQGTGTGPVPGDAGSMSRASTSGVAQSSAASGDLAMGATAGTAAAPHALGPDQIAAMTERLAARLAQQPDDADGWAMLARSHAMSAQHAKAVEAFRKAEALRPDDPVLLADFADALAMTRQRSLAGEPLQLVQRALKADPANLKALSLAGTEAFDRRDYRAAIGYWEALQQAGGPASAFVQQVQGGIAEARQLAGLLPPSGEGAIAPGVKVKISRGPRS